MGEIITPLSTVEAARLLNLDPSTLRKHVLELGGFKQFGRWFFHPQKIAEWQRGCISEAAQGGSQVALQREIKGVMIRSRYVYLTKRAAEIAEAEAVADYQRTGRLPTDLPTETPTDSCPAVLDLLNERVTWVELHRSKAYAKDHKYCFRRVLKRTPEWADMPVTDITVEMVEAWAESWATDLLDRGCSRKQINSALTMLEATWNRPWGLKRKEREFPNNPFALVERYSIEKKAKYLPTDAQAAKVLMATPPKGRLALELMIGSGARPSEAVVLQWVDVQVGREPFSVVLYTLKKRGGSLTPRRIPITLELAGRLRSWRKQNPETHYVFQQTKAGKDEGPLPNTYSWARRIQEKACDAAGVTRFTLHSWRHLYASRLARAGKSLPTIQALLGHENATTTNKYLHEILGLPPG